MTIAPIPHSSDYYHHPRTSSNSLSRDLDFLHRLSAHVPQTSSFGRDINNNDIGIDDHVEICYNTGSKPGKLALNGGDQLAVFGAPEKRRFSDTFLLPENVDPNSVYCELNRKNQLSINTSQMNFEANFSSMQPHGSARGGLW